MAERGYKLLEAIRRIPGHNDLGELKPSALRNGSQRFASLAPN